MTDQAIDPTLNVKEALAAAVKRLDDIRAADAEHDREMRDLGYKKDETIDRLRTELATAESHRIDALALAESRRLDALRAEDRSAITLATTRAELTAASLQQQVVTTERTLAAATEATAKTLSTAFNTAVQGLIDRVIPLEQSRYQQAGVKEQATEGKSDNRYIIGLVMSVPAFLIAIGAVVVAVLKP